MARRGEGPGLRAVAGLVPAITRKAFEKHGFAAASLIIDWTQIVGADIARLTRPERLKWPRLVEKAAEADEAQTGRPGATLVIRVDPAAALDIQYRKAQLLERINAYFGYRAVSELRIVQAGSDEEIGTPAAAGKPAGSGALPRRGGTTSAVATDLSSVDDGALRAALARLAASIGQDRTS